MQIIGANLTPKKVSVLCKVEEEHEHACACEDTTHSLVDVDVDTRTCNNIIMTSTLHSLVRVVVIFRPPSMRQNSRERLLNIGGTKCFLENLCKSIRYCTRYRLSILTNK